MFYSKRRKYKYTVREKFSIFVGIKAHIDTKFLNLTSEGYLTIQEEYAWDGPSGPTIDTKSFMRPSVIHDALYQLIRQGYLSDSLRLDVDQLLRRMCITDGMNRFRAWYVYKMVRAFGDKAIKSGVLTAP